MSDTSTRDEQAGAKVIRAGDGMPVPTAPTLEDIAEIAAALSGGAR